MNIKHFGSWFKETKQKIFQRIKNLLTVQLFSIVSLHQTEISFFLKALYNRLNKNFLII